MNKKQLDGLYLFLIGSAVFALLGTVLAGTSPVAMGDFRGMYYPARCLIQHTDPYLESDIIAVSRAEGGGRSWDIEHDSHFTRYIYFPTAFTLTVPFAIMPWGPAHLLWMALTAFSLIFASYLILNLAAPRAPVLAGALVCILLACSELLIVFGNVAGIAISLCVVAVWCFLRNKFVFAGILCLAISLAAKPQDSGLVWVYFLLAGGIYRKRALQTLGAMIVLCLPAVIWVWYLAPHWIEELRANVQAFSVPGGIMDPGLAAKGTFGLGMLISMQTVFAYFRDDPKVYNIGSYIVCAPLLIYWAVVTLRTRSTPAKAWFALAAISALSMLPVYHRQNDAKLLLLTIPACAILVVEGGLIGRLALLLNTAAIVLAGDLPWIIVLGLMGRLQSSYAGMARQAMTVMQVFSIPLTLLTLGVFYLWVYSRRCAVSAPPLQDEAGA
jgi:hypothetical protein